MLLVDVGHFCYWTPPSVCYPGQTSGAAAAAEATATATSTVADGSTGGEGVDGDHAQERPGTVDTSSQSSVRPAAEESREKMHRAAAASRLVGWDGDVPSRLRRLLKISTYLLP